MMTTCMDIKQHSISTLVSSLTYLVIETLDTKSALVPTYIPRAQQPVIQMHMDAK
jgi:hypothetical protein